MAAMLVSGSGEFTAPRSSRSRPRRSPPPSPPRARARRPAGSRSTCGSSHGSFRPRRLVRRSRPARVISVASAARASRPAERQRIAVGGREGGGADQHHLAPEPVGAAPGELRPDHHPREARAGALGREAVREPPRRAARTAARGRARAATRPSAAASRKSSCDQPSAATVRRSTDWSREERGFPGHEARS